MNVFEKIILKLTNVCKHCPAYIKKYIWPLPKFKQEIVAMVDGTQSHGGLTDRFRNILSIYHFWKENKIKFKLYYTYPCSIEHLLLPNHYNWHISKNELSYNFFDSQEIYVYVSMENLPREEKNRRNLEELNKVIRNKYSKTQYHVYGNAYFSKGKYKMLFEELFVPTKYLTERIAELSKNMTEPYEAVTLRFQQLLGDLHEGYDNRYKILPEEKREKLIDTCIKKIETLYNEGYFSTKKVLVTSDSYTFVERVSSLPFVYTISGRMEHMDYTKNSDLEINTKPFADLFLLKEAKRLTLIETGEMYPSGFPEFAAELGEKPYNHIKF